MRSSGPASDVLEYHPGSVEARLDPYPLYERMRREAPVYENREACFWALSRADDIQAATADWQTFSSMGAANGLVDSASANTYLVTADPPHHTRLRRLVSGTFGPKRIRQLHPFVYGLASNCIAQLLAMEGGDFMEVVAARLPTEVISELLGVPPSLRDHLRDLARVIVLRSNDSLMLPGAVVEAAATMAEIFIDLIDQRTRRPQNDVISSLIAAEVPDEDGRRRLEPGELMGFCILLYVAGSETVSRSLCTAMLAMQQYPDQFGLLQDDPRLCAQAAEETLRWEPPVHYEGRLTTRQATVRGISIPAGSRVLLLAASACQDENLFDEPRKFDLRRNATSHLAFGFGVHTCLGAALARLEIATVLRSVVETMDRFEINTDAVEWVTSGTVRGPTFLPMVVRGK